MNDYSDSAARSSTEIEKPAGMSRPLVLLLAVAAGMAVASIYYAHPLLDAIRRSLHLPVATAGLIVTASQLGYGLGLALLVPLGDLVERRGLVVWMTVGIAAGLVGMAVAPSASALFIAAMAVGGLSVVAQILVAFAATLAGPDEQGSIVGTMSGLLLGILFARTAAGYLAQLGGWRTVFWTAAGLMLVLAAALRKGLPIYRASLGVTYPGLIKSVLLDLLREEPILRLRAAYGGLAFAGFGALWTPLAFLLSQPPYRYASGTIGLFGFAGIAGALAASAAGRFADRGMAHLMTGITGTLLVVSWLLLKLENTW